jgi:transcription termination factor Rho
MKMEEIKRIVFYDSGVLFELYLPFCDEYMYGGCLDICGTDGVGFFETSKVLNSIGEIYDINKMTGHEFVEKCRKKYGDKIHKKIHENKNRPKYKTFVNSSGLLEFGEEEVEIVNYMTDEALINEFNKKKECIERSYEDSRNKRLTDFATYYIEMLYKFTNWKKDNKDSIKVKLVM